MPSKKPRVNVLLNEDDYAALRELSELNGESMSSIVAGLVGAVTPTVRRINDAVRAAQGMEAELRSRVGQSLQELEAELLPELEELEGHYRDVLEGREVWVPEPAPDPRLVTRGSVDPNPPTPLAAKRAARRAG